VCDVAGRVLAFGALLYAVARAAVILSRLVVRVMAGMRPSPSDVAEPMRSALAHAKAALPVVALGLLLILAGAVGRWTQRRGSAGPEKGSA
jgi:hypothetical protein